MDLAAGFGFGFAGFLLVPGPLGVLVPLCLAGVVPVCLGVVRCVRGVDFIHSPSVPVGVPDGGGPLDHWLDMVVYGLSMVVDCYGINRGMLMG